MSTKRMSSGILRAYDFLSRFAYSLSNIMVSRFLLDLRGINTANPAMDADTPTLLSTVRFAGVGIAGNLGAPIDTSESTWTTAAGDYGDDNRDWRQWDSEALADPAGNDHELSQLQK